MIEAQSKADNLRDTASELRRVADRMNPGDAQTEIVELADRFERLAEHAERKSRTDARDTVGRALPPSGFVGV